MTSSSLAGRSLASSWRRRSRGTARSGADSARSCGASGAVSRLDLFHALAETWGIGFVDLIDDPPDEALLRRVGAEVMVREHWVPHHLEPGAGVGPRAVVATAEPPSAELEASVRERLDLQAVRFVATTDWDVDQAVLLACEEELVAEAAFGLALDASRAVG